MSGTYEQYGSGPWVVRTWDRDGRGAYRFQTEAEAREWIRRNAQRSRVRLSHSGRRHHLPLFPG